MLAAKYIEHMSKISYNASPALHEHVHDIVKPWDQ